MSLNSQREVLIHLSIQQGDLGLVKDASLMQMYSFLPASWAGDTHEETNILPIGNREEMRQATSRPSY